MLKLPQLASSKEQRSGSAGSLSAYNPFMTSPSRYFRDANGILGGEEAGLELKTWKDQAQNITADMVSSDKYKSIALHAEVRLAEALDKCTRASPASLTPGGDERPNKLRTAVCCQLLGEFAELCGPLSGVLKSIRDELLKSIFSELYISERGHLVFDQQTWFNVAEKLEQEKAVMLDEREGFKRQLQEQHQTFLRIEEQVEAYRQAVTNAQLEAAASKSRLESLMAGHQAALTEAKTGREELKRARKEWLKMKDELESEINSHKNLKEIHEFTTNEYKEQVADREAKIEALRKDLENYVPVSTIQGLKSQCEEAGREAASARVRVSELEGSIVVLEAKLETMQIKLGSMTPRPSWAAVETHLSGPGLAMTPPTTTSKGHSTASKTQETLQRVAARLDAYRLEVESSLLEAKAQDEELQLMDALLLPDPIPSLVSLSLVADSSAYFITEQEIGEERKEGGSSSPGLGEDGAISKAYSPPMISVEGLGITPDVPRCLRWKGGDLLKIEAMSLEAAEVEAEIIWAAKAEHDDSHSTMHLTSFLYPFYSKALEKQLRDAEEASSSSEGPMRQTLTRIEFHRRVVTKAYTLFHACSLHSSQSSKIRLLSAVLTGQLPEAAHVDLLLMKRGLFDVLISLPHSNGFIYGTQASNCLVTFYPHRDAWALHKLKEAFRTAFLIGSESASLHTLMSCLIPSADVAFLDSLKQEGDDGDDVFKFKTLGSLKFSDGEASFINLLEQQYLDELEVFADGIVKAMSTQPIASRSDEPGDHQWSREEVLVKAGMCRRAAQQALAQFSSPDSLRAFYLLKQEDAFDVDGAMKALYPDQESGKKDPLGALSIATLPEVA